LFISFCLSHITTSDYYVNNGIFVDFMGNMALRFIFYMCIYIYMGVEKDGVGLLP